MLTPSIATALSTTTNALDYLQADDYSLKLDCWTTSPPRYTKAPVPRCRKAKPKFRVKYRKTVTRGRRKRPKHTPIRARQNRNSSLPRWLQEPLPDPVAREQWVIKLGTTRARTPDADFQDENRVIRNFKPAIPLASTPSLSKIFKRRATTSGVVVTVNFDGSYRIVLPDRHEGIWGLVLSINSPSIFGKAENERIWEGSIYERTSKGFAFIARTLGTGDAEESSQEWIGVGELVGDKLIVTRENNQYTQVFSAERAPRSETDKLKADFDSDSNDSDA